jgi:SAM-dependent methyltransferase
MVGRILGNLRVNVSGLGTDDMRVAEFWEKLPSLFEEWGTTAMHPRGSGVDIIAEEIKQGNTTNFYQLVRAASRLLEPGEAFCEIGCLAGGNLVTALRENTDVLGYGIDFYSPDEDESDLRIEVLQKNLEQFGVLERVCFSHTSVDDFFCEFGEFGVEEQFGVYVYNFVADYRQVLMSLLSVRPFMAAQGVMIVNSAQMLEVQQAISDFLVLESRARVLLDWQLGSVEIFGGQGLVILAWDEDARLARFDSLVVEGVEPENTIDSAVDLWSESTKKKVLHVGCGPYNPNALPPELRTEDWQEIRLDIDPKMQPDILGTITDLSSVPDNSVDAVYSSHNLEHIYDYEVPLALAEFKRVLKPGGLTWLVVPDMQLAAEWVVKGDMDDQPLYISPAGPVKALWMFYGMGTSIPGMPYMAHKTGFTASGLKERLVVGGFEPVEVWRGNFNVYARGYK